MKPKQKKPDDFVQALVIGVMSICAILTDSLAWPEAWHAIRSGSITEHIKYSTVSIVLTRRENPARFWIAVGFRIAFGLIFTVAAGLAIYAAVRQQKPPRGGATRS